PTVFPFIFTRLHRSPPPFPYTTLFRSVLGPANVDAIPMHNDGSLIAFCGVRPDRVPWHIVELCRCHLDRQRCRVLSIVSPQPAEDRKSTRLNSSHVSISYAVFCLKKQI